MRAGPRDTQSAGVYISGREISGCGGGERGDREGGRRGARRERRNTFSLVKEQPHNLRAEFQARALTRPHINFTGYSKPRLK